MSTQGQHERRGNPHTTKEAAAGPKQHQTRVQQNSYPNILQQQKSKLKVKTKQCIQRPEIPHLGQSAKNTVGLKYFDMITTLHLLNLATVKTYFTIKHT